MQKHTSACPVCLSGVEKGTNQCNKCAFKGQFLDNNQHEETKKVSKSWISIIIYYAVSIGFLGLYKKSLWFSESYQTLISLNLIWGVFTLVFAFYHRAMLLPILRNTKLMPRPLALVILMAFWGGIGMHYLVDLLSQKNYLITFPFWQSESPILLSVLFMCLHPAIFEELAFRGFLFGNLLRVGNAIFAVVVSSVLFALLHFDFFALLWLFPIGLLLAYFRNKYQSLWYGVIGHFTYNLVIISFEFY